jgi:outer membrane protein OmpA-like peptidoglycan-associated protein
MLGVIGCCALVAASCSLLRAPAASDRASTTRESPPAQLAQLDFSRQATFARCVPPACPVRTRKTLAPETPNRSIEHATSSTPVEAVAPTPAPPPAPEPSRTVTVQFGLGSARLGPAAQSQLNSVMADLLLARRITIIGRTDNTGPLAFNEGLALARAFAVRDYLRTTHPTLAATLTLRARGACCFIATNDTAAGRAQNRRVEVILRMSEEGPS